MWPDRPPESPLEFSIVVPVFDEEVAVAPLAREIALAFAGEAFEMLFVDDASVDGTAASLIALAPTIPQLRILSHRRNAGQSRAIRTGVLAARAPIVVMLDGDGQNDPADAPRMARVLRAAPPELG
ncbi:MAG: glycosyltransferase family 2 protein, partial [Pseudomonadota bacterium]